MAIQVIKIDIGQPLSELSKEILATVEQGLDDVANAIRDDFLSTVSTWEEKPDFDIQKAEMARVIGTDSQIYAYVNSGTRVRYATMTPDFQAKTEPNVLTAKVGQGGLAYVNRLRPRPGIQARNYCGQVYRNRARNDSGKNQQGVK
jgi:hypothetical protein